ncbi:MAG: energy-coupled thiamine transporter ThiT [Lachnospiraceae bacterium]|nr:energy-coupled thiamine transporter ThiT [Lachnospiraceae bacterium]
MTKAGTVVLVLVLLAVMLLTAFIADKKQGKPVISPKQLAMAGISLALAFITSFIRYEMPFGGEVTLFSMFFICFAGYLFGVRVGLLTAFAYSLLQFMHSGGAYMLTPFQVCCDYFFAFTALGLSGIWKGKKNGLKIGYVVGCIMRGLFHTIGGYLYWMDYMPESFPKALAAFYPIIYNYSYIIIEMVATLFVISVPAVKRALERIERQSGEGVAVFGKKSEKSA